MIDEKALNFLELYLFAKIFDKLNKMKISYKMLTDTPPEFSQEFINDPLNFTKYQYFVALKSCYKEPVAALAVYIFEQKLGVKVFEVYYHDFVAGSPAWYVGYSGRDLDLVLVVNRKVQWDIVKNIEKYLDDLIGLAITYYYCVHSQCDEETPFNKLINHNLIELHVITPDEKPRYNLDGAMHGNIVEKADIEKLRRMIYNFRELKQFAKNIIKTEEGVKIIIDIVQEINKQIRKEDTTNSKRS